MTGVRWTLLLVAVMLAACANKAPELVRRAPGEQPLPAQVQEEAERYLDQPVRWGGEVVTVHNLPDSSEIEILARPLWSDGPPREGGPALGRFLAVLQGFVDPAEYAPGRAVTVAGRVRGSEVRPVGEFPYSYPKIEVEAHQLWDDPPVVSDPWYRRSTFHDPWWPYRRRCWLTSLDPWCW